MKRFLSLLFLVAFLPLVLRADDETKLIQQSLKAQGFFYGEVNGTASDETTQAVRRFQIRNALTVTGQLDDATRKAIFAGGNTAAPAEPPPLEAAPRPRANAPAPNSPPAPIARPDLRAEPSQPAPGPRFPSAPSSDGPVPDGTTTYRGGSSIFYGGPFAGAPPFVQSSVLGQAQGMLAREGFFTGVADGIPGPRTVDALKNYQAAYGLPRTGRLDANTAGALGIAPVGTASPPRNRPPRQRVYEPPAPRSQGTGVYEGKVVPESAPR